MAGLTESACPLCPGLLGEQFLFIWVHSVRGPLLPHNLRAPSWALPLLSICLLDPGFWLCQLAEHRLCFLKMILTN